VKQVRVLSQLACLSLAAAAFAGLTRIYAGSVRPPLPDPNFQAERLHRPSALQLNRFPEFVGDGMILALFALAGRIIFRLRLSPVPRRHGPTLLNLHQEREIATTLRDPEIGP
jgi:hypothetical protein